MAAPKKKDLSPKTAVKGGRKGSMNDNMTLVRGAQPVKRDLPALKDVKAGKKAASVRGGKKKAL